MYCVLHNESARMPSVECCRGHFTSCTSLTVSLLPVPTHVANASSHELDLLDHLVGPLRPLSGAARRLRPTTGLPDPSYAVEDAVSLSFETPSGALGVASWNFCSGSWQDTIEIVGELGSVSFSCFNNQPVQVEIAAKVISMDDEDEGSQLTRTNGRGGLKRVKRFKERQVTQHQAEQPEHVHQPLVEAVLRDLHKWRSLPADSPEKAAVAAAAHGGEACTSTGTAAARTALVMDRALEDFYGGRGSRDAAFWETPEKWVAAAT